MARASTLWTRRPDPRRWSRSPSRARTDAQSSSIGGRSYLTRLRFGALNIVPNCANRGPLQHGRCRPVLDGGAARVKKRARARRRDERAVAALALAGRPYCIETRGRRARRHDRCVLSMIDCASGDMGLRVDSVRSSATFAVSSSVSSRGLKPRPSSARTEARYGTCLSVTRMEKQCAGPARGPLCNAMKTCGRRMHQHSCYHLQPTEDIARFRQ
mmetsp:Transcript_16539/g.35453  ORF Transcript_16539/g.35453 Transcript_16539/m.35453 type:complete len:215 (+) Transcript_16539:1225-1869(+)